MDRDKLIREAFIDELNKTAGMATIGKVLSRVMGKGSKKWVKDSIAYGKRNTVSSKRIGKSGIVARGKNF